MKKTRLLSLLLVSFCLTACVQKVGPHKDDDVIIDDDEKEEDEDDNLVSWTSEQISLFNTYLKGYILPKLPVAATVFKYSVGSLDIQCPIIEGIDEQYDAALKKAGFATKFDEKYQTYGANLTVNDSYIVSLDYFCDIESEPNVFQIYAKTKDVKKEREHVWTSEEKSLFDKYFSGYYLPFPDTTNVSVRTMKNFGDDCVYITGNYSNTILDSYLEDLTDVGFDLSKHRNYGIDVGKYQLSNNRYLEVWVAIVNEQSGKWFEIFAYTRAGNYKVVDNKHVAFGSYPQTQVLSGSSLYSTIKNLVREYPTASDHKGWEMFSDYYGEEQFQEHGFYKDVNYNGEKYRATYALAPRCIAIQQPLDGSEGFFQTDVNGYEALNLYVFKYEPIIWSVMETKEGVSFLAPSNVLDYTIFTDHLEPAEIEGKTIYINNYEHSFIRSWINNEFYNTAFSDEEKIKIQTTLVDNSMDADYPTQDDYDTMWCVGHENAQPEDYLSNNTNDKVFLPSRKEIVTYDFGFDGDMTSYNEGIDHDKACKPLTEYALSRGGLTLSDTKDTIYKNATTYYLRTPLICSADGWHEHVYRPFSSMNYGYARVNQVLGAYPCINVKL